MIVYNTPADALGLQRAELNAHDWRDCYPVIDSRTDRVVGIVRAEKGHAVLAGRGGGAWDDETQAFWIPETTGMAAHVIGCEIITVQKHAKRQGWEPEGRDIRIDSDRLARLRELVQARRGRPTTTRDRTM